MWYQQDAFVMQGTAVSQFMPEHGSTLLSRVSYVTCSVTGMNPSSYKPKKSSGFKLKCLIPGKEI